MTPQELRAKMQELEGQEFQLLGAAFAMIVFTGVVLAFAAVPPLRAKLPFIQWNDWYLPAICLLLIGGSIYFGVYARQKRLQIFDARRQLAGQMGAADLSLLDPLTGLLNRQYLDPRVSKEIGWVQRMPEVHLTLAMLDLDGFRAYNSRFGRSAGDQLLLEFTGLLKKNFRGADTLVRFGGDEFVVMMLGVREPKAREILARLQQMIDQVNQANAGFRLAFHWGLAEYAQGMQLDGLINTAYQRMLQGKTAKAAPA